MFFTLGSLKLERSEELESGKLAGSEKLESSKTLEIVNLPRPRFWCRSSYARTAGPDPSLRFRELSSFRAFEFRAFLILRVFHFRVLLIFRVLKIQGRKTFIYICPD